MDNYNFFPLFLLFLAWRPSWLEIGITGQNVGRGPSKDHSSKIWSKLAQWFLRRKLKCEKLRTDDGRRRRTTDETWWQKHTRPLARWANKKGGGWNFQLRLLFVFKLNILPIWREYPMTYFTKHKTLRT
jgi:hypothetical protein